MSRIALVGFVSSKPPRALAFLVAFAVIIVASFAAEPAISGSERRAEDVTLRVIGNFSRPLYVARAPGAANKGLLFVVEESGTIQVLDRNQPAPEPFLDIRSLVADEGEQGLLSVAFAPDYATSGLFYVYFSNLAGNNEVSEFRVSSSNPRQADLSSRRRVIEFQHPGATNHNGGQLNFGPDGMLWIATGDGGGSGGGDPGENAQNLDVLLGKILRIDPREPSGYSIPSNNPFVDAPGRDEIWSYGFRNPWRFSFGRDRTLLIGDVGQSAWEEIDYVTLRGARGANFGWDNYEASHLFEGPPLADHTLPIHEYAHDGELGYCSVTGGYMVRDASLPFLRDRYVYADYCSGELRTLAPKSGGTVGDQPLGITVSRPTSFGEGTYGRIYVTSRDGQVYRLVAG